MKLIRIITIIMCIVTSYLLPVWPAKADGSKPAVPPPSPGAAEQAEVAAGDHESSVRELNHLDRALDELEEVFSDGKRKEFVKRLMDTETIDGMEKLLREINENLERYNSLQEHRRRQRERINGSLPPRRTSRPPTFDGQENNLNEVDKVAGRKDSGSRLARFVKAAGSIINANLYLNEESNQLHNKLMEKLHSASGDNELLYMWEDDFKVFTHEIRAISDQAERIYKRARSLAKFNHFKRTFGKELFSHTQSLSLQYQYDTLEDFLCQEAKDSYSRISTFFQNRIESLHDKRWEAAQSEKISWQAARFGKQAHYYGSLLQLTESDVVDGHLPFTLTSKGSPAFFEVFLSVNGKRIRVERQMTLQDDRVTTVFQAMLPVEGRRQLQVKYGTSRYENSRWLSNEHMVILLLQEPAE